MRTAVVALGDVEIVSQGPYNVEPAATLAKQVRRQLGNECEAWSTIEHVQDRGEFAPVEHDFNGSRREAHDVTEQFAEYELRSV